MIGIIGGYFLSKNFDKLAKKTIPTPYGKTDVFFGKIGNAEGAFIPRHGMKHTIPPHKVNYMANVWSLKEIGVKNAMTIYSCGIIRNYAVGDLILADDFIGFYSQITFFDDFSKKIVHTDVVEPYTKKLQRKVLDSSRKMRIECKTGGIIATYPGPRFKTRAEIKALKIMGANLTSMTNAYEITLLSEVKIPTVGLCIGTNYATGIRKEVLTHEKVKKAALEKNEEVNSILHEFANSQK
ncbi:MAG: MTAP family purine nucleoside phosphorylase [Candidatus Micrarchaeota archaeon]